MRILWKFLICLIIVIVFNSCDRAFKDEKQFYEYWNNLNNGLKKEKVINGIKIEMKFLPPRYLAYKEKQKNSMVDIDSLTSYYSSFISMIMTFSNALDESGEIMFKEIMNMNEYEQRIENFSFKAGEYLLLRTDKGSIKPALTTLEDIIPIDNKPKLYIIFADENDKIGLSTSKEFTINFDDRIFNTGISEFTFKSNDLNDLPKFEFIK